MMDEPTTKEEAVKILKDLLEEKYPVFDTLIILTGKQGLVVDTQEEDYPMEGYGTKRFSMSTRKYILPTSESEKLCEIIGEYADNSVEEFEFEPNLMGFNIRSRFPKIEPSLDYSGIGVYVFYPEGEISEEIRARYFLEGVDTISGNFSILERKIDDNDWEKLS